MYSGIQKRSLKREKRVLRVRKKLRGTAEKPRLSVFKSNRHLFVQIIDDDAGLTLASVGTYSKKKKESSTSKENAKNIGLAIGKKAKEKNIQAVVFDRGRFKFHGVIAELATGAREAGLQF